jgi:hypothetical protein
MEILGYLIIVCGMSSLQAPPSLPQSSVEPIATMIDIVTAPNAGFNLEEYVWILEDPSFLPPSLLPLTWSPMSLLADVRAMSYLQ